MAIIAAVALASVIALAASFRREEPLTDWVRETDAICTSELGPLRRLRTRLDAASAAGEPGTVFRRSATILGERATVERDVLDRVEALPRPGGSSESIAAWIAASRRRVALTGTLAAAYEERDDAGIAQLTGRLDRQAGTSSAQARKLGMRVCARREKE